MKNNDADEFTTEQRWLAALSRERQIWDKINWTITNGPIPTTADMWNWESKPGSIPTRGQLQEWWGAVQGVWQEYTRQVAAGNPPNPPPFDLALVMAGLCGYLAVGKLPDPIRDAITEGRTLPGPMELSDVGKAVAYHRAAKTGIYHNGKKIVVVDPTPTKTISKSYGVTTNTVRGWIKKYPPAFLGVTDIDSNILCHLMETGGKRYIDAGRSQAAIIKRARAAKNDHHATSLVRGRLRVSK